MINNYDKQIWQANKKLPNYEKQKLVNYDKQKLVNMKANITGKYDKQIWQANITSKYDKQIENKQIWQAKYDKLFMTSKS